MPRYTKAMRIADFYSRMEKLGFTYQETETLRRAQLTLHRWAERECNGEVERDEETGLTYYFSNSRCERTSHRVPDLETGAWKRVESVVSARNERENEGLVAYHQTDPRGCALYLVNVYDTLDKPIESIYSRGFAVCIG